MIRLDDVTMAHMPGAKPAFDSVTLGVERRESVFLVDKPGPGRSASLQLVMRKTKTISGKVRVLERDVSKTSNWSIPKSRRQIDTVSQDFRLLPSKTVYENVALAMQVIGKPKYQIRLAIPEALKLVDLAGKEKHLPRELSGGEEQRVVIVCAMANHPELLLANEPTGNLDPETSLRIVQLLDRINCQRAAIVMVTHDTEIVNQLRKCVIELHGSEAVHGQLRGVYGAAR